VAWNLSVDRASPKEQSRVKKRKGRSGSCARRTRGSMSPFAKTAGAWSRASAVLSPQIVIQRSFGRKAPARLCEPGRPDWAGKPEGNFWLPYEEVATANHRFALRNCVVQPCFHFATI
jgi:hypothetical protein